MSSHDLDAVLRRAVAEGVLSDDQRARVLALAEAERPRGPESPRALNAVTIAYVVGALLVLFAFAWFLVDRWSRLGPWGVMAVALTYAAIFVAGARWLERNRFPTAAGVALMLAVAQAPLVAWSLLTLAGRWPLPSSRDSLLHYGPWMAWQWMIVELTTILAALLVLRRRPVATLAYPVAVALWGLWYHLGELFGGQWGSYTYKRWIVLAGALAVLVVADLVERWQAKESAARRRVDGDFAGPFWLVGMLGLGASYVSLWDRAGAWRHFLPFVALFFLAISLYLGRRLLLVFGMLGVFAYLAYLADDVFRDFISFPILLAALGALTILATVWLQRGFPGLVQRVDRWRGEGDRALPWSPALSFLAPISALVLAIASHADAADERAQQKFLMRWQILRQHSGSMRHPSAPVRPVRPVPSKR